MKIETTANDRKDIVKAMTELTGETSKYMGPPTFAYQIGNFTVALDGSIEVEEGFEEDGERILECLKERGLAEDGTGIEDVELNIPISEMDGRKIANLIFLIHSKQYLLNKAFGKEVFKVDGEFVKALEENEVGRLEDFHKIFKEHKAKCKGFDFSDENAIFTYILENDGDKLRAFIELTAMMVGQAKEQNRISPKETIEENEKYYLRIWLVRLGLGGRGGKETRTTLLSNLKGHSAFRTKEEEERAKERNKKKRLEAKKA
jgi:hypothetical protein